MDINQLDSNIIVYIEIPTKSLERNTRSSIYFIIIFLSVYVLLVTNVVVLLPITSYSQSSSNITSANNIITNKSSKIIILGFDDNRKGDFTYAKPILDKYGFKATFFIICGKTTDKGAMNWQDIAAMQRDGMDIESHTMTHKHLNHLSLSALNFEIAGSKQCLANHGYNVTSFAYPYDEGADNVTVVNTVAKNYELARSGSDPLMFLHCNGFKKHPQTDCRTYLPDGKLTYANKYAVRSLSFDRYEIKGLFNNSTIFSDFVKIVNSQINYNNGGTINAVPLITFHNVLPLGSKPYSTNVAIFDQLMKYLHDNGFRVVSMNNLAFDAKNNAFYIKSVSD
ncbi:MAG: polysaccharide deacetylase family protein [Thermoproteota archaeon]|nr:polysaccharide deacetylase family protein [Thermoproteota archaeon]